MHVLVRLLGRIYLVSSRLEDLVCSIAESRVKEGLTDQGDQMTFAQDEIMLEKAMVS
jgi:hypothetical protein